jgi:hypothetical protein
MKRSPVILALIAVAALAVSAYSCRTSSTSLRIVTDVPEVLEYLEYLRREGDVGDIRVDYLEDPDRIVALGGVRPDLIISTEIAHDDFSEFLRPIPLRRLEGQSRTVADGFVLADLYPESYEPFVRDNAVRVLPLAFDLPILYLGEDYATRLSGRTTISYTELLTLSRESNRLSGDNFTDMGFSTLRNLRFIELMIRDLTDTRGSLPPRDSLAEALEEIDGLLDEYQQGPSAQLYFNAVFAYAPDHAELADGRLSSAMGSLFDMVNASGSLISEYPFLWLASQAGVEVISPGIYAGILKQSPRGARATAFLRLMLSSRMQAGFLKADRGADLAIFLDRMSSNRLVNERIVPEINAGLQFPSSEDLRFPGIPDPLWDDMRAEVLTPWLDARFSTGTVNLDSLYRDADTFYKLNGGYN